MPNAASPAHADATGDRATIAQLAQVRQRILGELSKVIVGQEEAVEQLLIAIFARGHVLLEGVPGLAKTLLISTLAKCLQLDFRRIQFTPDLMPADITGTEILQEDPQTHERRFKFLKGPVFSNILLADEINRTPPKTQAALLEAMAERRVSIGGANHRLDLPFFVLATQNPIEQEGTYSLPEAQLDRFLFKIQVGYPERDEELEVIRRVSSPAMGAGEKSVSPVLAKEHILALQEVVLRLPAAEHVLEYARELVRATRVGSEEAPGFIKEQITWGAGPRAGISLMLAAKARAALHGQAHVACEDVAAVALPVLRHRIMCSYAAQAEGVTTDDVVRRLIERIPIHENRR